MLPSIFCENLFDDSLSDFFDFGRMMPQVSSELYGKHARNLMKTDVRELDGSYELDVDLPGFKKDEVTVDLNGPLNWEQLKEASRRRRRRSFQSTPPSRSSNTQQCTSAPAVSAGALGALKGGSPPWPERATEGICLL